MSKLMSRLVSMARLFMIYEEWTGWNITTAAATIITLVNWFLLHNFRSGLNYWIMMFIPTICFIIIPVFAVDIIHKKGGRQFAAIFNFLPELIGQLDEDQVMFTLKKLAQAVVNLEKTANNPFVPINKPKVLASFWSAWWAAKAFGFPVFKSLHTHAKYTSDGVRKLERTAKKSYKEPKERDKVLDTYLEGRKQFSGVEID